LIKCERFSVENGRRFASKFCYICRTKTDVILNYLAHIFLSGNRSKLQVGNFIGDFVKGSKFKNYPAEIRDGILLHRQIDDFTDSHPMILEMISFLRPAFGRYSGIVSDMYLDYFLANNFHKYSKLSLNSFAFRFYIHVLLNYRYLPKRVKGFVFHFIFSNRLAKYAKLEGLRESLEIMSNHKVKAIKPDKTIDFLQQHHDIIENWFTIFFEDLLVFVHEKQK